MSDASVLIANERIKYSSTIGGNLGTALFIAAIGRWFLNGFDAFVALWLIASAMLIWAAWYVLMLMESEAQTDE
jgi:hypothetical protein